MSSKLVELDLDKPRMFRFTMADAREVCRALSAYPGKGNVTSLSLIIMLGGMDMDAWSHVLAEGLKHEEPNLRPERALRYLQEAHDNGKDIEAIAKAIRKAGELGGVWRKPEDDEDARGNVSTPSTTSRSMT